MKNTIKFIGNIFKKRTIKMFLGVLILLGVSSMFLANNNVIAQGIEASETTNATEDDKLKSMSEINELFTYISNAVYALLWPVLFIAGIALDNRLVYGSFLHLDASLWALWNIMKNFANFALGFLVLFAIVRNIFTGPFGGKSGEKRGPISIIKKTLIAGVLIQASWFLVAAVIDISTILTYSIGGLPMTVMQSNPQQSDQPILGIKAVVHTKGSGGNNKMSLQYYNTYGDVNISPCYTTKKVPGLTGSYVVGREQILVKSGQAFSPGYCTLGGWPYRYLENPDYEEFSIGTNEIYIASLKEYFQSGAHDIDYYSGLVDDCKIIPVDFSNLSIGCKNQGYGILKKDDAFFKDAGNTNNTKFTLTNILEKSKGFVGPFITIYSSMLSFSDLATAAPGDSVVGDFLDLIIKLFFALVLFIPLVVLAIVLIVRIGLLRLVIAASPVLVLLAVFKNELNIKGSGEGIMAYFDGPQIVKLIFAPVFVVFAISMSMIFLSALNPKNTSKDAGLSDRQFEELGITKNEKSFSFLGLMEVELDMERINKGMDMLSWFITMFFATGIMRFFLFFAIRMTKIGDKIGKGFQESTQNLVKNLPIIPIGGGIGIKAAKEGLDKLGSVIPERLNRQQTDQLKERFPWLYPGVTEGNRGKEGSFDGISKDKLDIILRDIRGGSSMKDVLETHKSTLQTAGITTTTGLLDAYNDYLIKNADKIEELLAEPQEAIDSTTGIPTYDVGGILKAETATAYFNSEKGKERAKTAIGKNIKTSDGTWVLVDVGDVLNPEYKLLTEQEYNDQYLSKVIDKDGKLNKDEGVKILKNQIKDATKPENKNEAERDRMKEDWINAQLEAHKRFADKRLEFSSSSGDNSDPSGDNT